MQVGNAVAALVRVGVVVLVAASWAWPCQARADEELEAQAARQLAFARDELAQGLCERSLSSAQSALRLSPGSYDAFVVKALAYECLGDAKRARAMLIAYREIVGEALMSPEAIEAAERLLPRGPGRKKRQEKPAAKKPKSKPERKEPPALAVKKPVREAPRAAKPARETPSSAPKPAAVALSGSAGLDRQGLLVSIGGGGVLVDRLEAERTTIEADGVGQIDLGVRLPIGDRGVAFHLGGGWSNLPVPGCRAVQTRANGLAVQLGPGLVLPVRGRVRFSGVVTAHLGLSYTSPSVERLEECSTRRLELDDEVLYGARLQLSDGEARVPYAALGFRGVFLAVGADLRVGLLFGTRATGGPWIGAQVFLRHSQLLPVFRGDRYYLPPEGSEGTALSSVSLSGMDGSVSSARFQFGLAVSLLF